MRDLIEPGKDRKACSVPEGESKPEDRGEPRQTDPDGHEAATCFVVGIGASAGGLEALEHIFTVLPADCDIAFVVAMHLPAEGPSFLADFLRRYTSMRVKSAEDGMVLAPNTVYVMPPGCEIFLNGDILRLAAACGPVVTRHPIDRLFISMANEIKERAIAVVLSGNGRDGGEGVLRIRENAGIVIVQEPGTAANSPMPGNAIATGAADLILPVEEIAAKIAEIARGHCILARNKCLTKTLDDELRAICAVVKERTGHDFSSYKKNTLLRRIERRMSVNESGGLGKYITFLRDNPREAQALCQEILIGVTGFFRDAEAFEVLNREMIPLLFHNRGPENPVRIWHPCCSTGEEAYSVAMLVHEHMEKEGLEARVQIFATDIDEASVVQARSGLYPEDIAPEVGEDRLKRYFTRVNGKLQVDKRLREMILFAHHSIIKDPPFSRLDLLVCRNFLIYLDSDMQKRLFSLFHTSLKPGGFLFLGSAETVGQDSELFAPVDKKWKIFRRLENGRVKDIFFPLSSPRRISARTAPMKKPSVETARLPGAMAEKLIADRYSPPFIVVDEKYQVLHVSSNARRFLEVPVGEPSPDLLVMAREELRPALRVAVYKSFAEQGKVEFRGVKTATETGESAVNVLVEPLAADPSFGKMALVVLEKESLPAASLIGTGNETCYGEDAARDLLVRQLEEQLRVTHEQLQVTTEQLESSNESFMAANEELMSINEEFQSANEELQSTNEELETSQVELQALNEELVKVNAELHLKVEELDHARSDMENLFASSEIASVFLDRELIINRFSPAMAGILKLIPADVGRPFRNLYGPFDWSGLPADARAVLEKQVPLEREIMSMEDGRCFIMRVLPYRTTEGRIDGIVVTLIDISERKRAEEALRRSKEEWERTFDSVPDLIAILDDSHRITRMNRAMAERLGVATDECVGKICYRSVHGMDRPPALCPHAMTMSDGMEHVEEVREDSLGGDFIVSTTPLRDASGRMIGAVHVARDISRRKRAEDELRRHVEELERFNRATVGRELRMVELKREVNLLNERLGEPPRYPLDFIDE